MRLYVVYFDRVSEGLDDPIVARQLLIPLSLSQTSGGCHVHALVSFQKSSSTPVTLREPDCVYAEAFERATRRPEVETLSRETPRNGWKIRRSHRSNETPSSAQSEQSSGQGNAHPVEIGAAFHRSPPSSHLVPLRINRLAPVLRTPAPSRARKSKVELCRCVE